MTEYAQRNAKGYYEVHDVINWFLTRDSMSPKKLQKLLYYAYAWTLTLQNEDVDNLENKLFEHNFEAWVHGPVAPPIYHEFKHFGYNNIPRMTDYEIRFDDEIEDILNQVWETYGHFTGNELESITHQEAPWLNARRGLSPMERGDRGITDIDIFNCYIQNVEYED